MPAVLNPTNLENALKYGQVIPSNTKKDDSINNTILWIFLALIVYVVFK